MALSTLTMPIDQITHILLVLLGISLAIQLYFLLFVQLRLARYPVKKIQGKQQNPVSVIICVRNEAELIRQHLPAFLEQDYPEFELIIVNDCSWDETEDLLRTLAAEHKNLKVVTVPEQERFKRNKKFALSMGIKAAQHEHLLLSEMDCKPASKKWIKEMQDNFVEGAEFVLGYAPQQKFPGVLPFFMRYETFLNALNYLSFALNSGAFMGTGRNIAYLKSVFFRSKGFASHMHIPSGDDVLFVNQHAGNDNVRIEVKPGAQVWNSSKMSFGKFVKQKLKDMQLAVHFKFKDRFKLQIQFLSALLFYGTLLALLILQFDWRMVLGIYLLRLVLQFGVYYKIFKRLSYPELKWSLPVLDFAYLIFMLILNTVFLFKNKAEWK